MEQRINHAYLLIGGNMGNRNALLETARRHITQECGHISRQSSVYETEAWGKTDQPSFLNQVVEVETLLAPTTLMEKILAVEMAMGRKRNEKYGPRLMDIDILLFNDAMIQLPHLVIPHPHLAQRRFALTPLAELVPHYLHPILKISIQQMLEQCTDPLHVHKL